MDDNVPSGCSFMVVSRTFTEFDGGDYLNLMMEAYPCVDA